MISDFDHFKITKLSTPYTTTIGTHFNSTASITFFDDKNKELDSYELAFIDIESIYKRIDRGEALILDECYIENFSISKYRKSRNIAEGIVIKLIEFSAKSAFFNSTIETDFSCTQFVGNQFSIEGCRFISGGVSFHEAIFPDGNKHFSKILFKNGNVNFSNARFNDGTVDFKYSIFKDGIKNFQYTQFGKGDVLFINTEFGEGEVNFINANFGDGNVSFKLAIFKSGIIGFEFSHFGKGDISFERTEFGNGFVDFRKVEFNEGKVNFNRALFGEGDVTFEGSELTDSRMTFKKTDFGNGNLAFEAVEFKTSDVLFENALFGKGNIYFGKSLFKNLSLISCHLNHYCDLRVFQAEYIDLSGTISRDIIDLAPYGNEVKIDCLNLAGMRLVGQIYIDWYENKVYESIIKQHNTSNTEKAEQFRILKENYSRLGNYKYEDLAYIQFKRFEQKAEFYTAIRKSKLNAIWQYPLFAFKFITIDRMGLYATSPSRVIVSLITVYVIFSLIHLVCPYCMDTGISCIPQDASFISRVLSTFYYSIITFTTVGYGDCCPIGFLRLVAGFEAFAGPFMMSYFTVAFARKILR